MKNVGLFAATALAIATFAFTPSSAAAQSYSGNWKITWNVTYPASFSGTHTYCMKLTDDGSIGFAHSGVAFLNGSGISNLQGVFQVINGEFVATFLQGTTNGELDTQVFVGPASKGSVSSGFGLEAFDDLTGPAKFTKNGCTEEE